MADPLHRPDPNGDTAVKAGRGLPTGTPGWVKVFGIIAIVLVLLVVIHLLTGDGPGMHGMVGMHAPPAVGQTPS